jgi:hypothetical protein
MKYAYDYKPFKDVGEILSGSSVLFAHETGERIEGGASTEACKEVLDKWSPSGDWKRLWKKKIYQSVYDWVEYRTFSSKSLGKVVTVANERFGKFYVYDFNLQDFMDEIEEIVSFANKYYIGTDYTSILYNPITKVVWLPMGDGGSISTDDLAEALRDPEKYFDSDEEMEIKSKHYLERNIEFVTESVYSDEFEPPLTMGFVPIGMYKEFEY